MSAYLPWQSMSKPPLTTDNLKLSYFEVHGSLSIQIDGRILRSRARGPFNREMLEPVAVVEHPLFAKMTSGGDWVEVLEFWNSALATAEAFAALEHYLQSVKTAGIAPLATAIVLDDTLEGAAIMRERYAAAYASADWPCAFFSQSDAAEAWARQMLNRTPPG